MIDLTTYPDIMDTYKEMEKKHMASVKLLHKEQKKTPCVPSDIYDEIFKPYTYIQENVLTPKLFDLLVKLDPVVIEKRTGMHLKFTEVFGKNFSVLDELMSINVCLMAIESSVIYKFNEGLIRPDGKIIEEGPFKYKQQIGYECPIWRNGKEIDTGYQNGLPLKIFEETPYKQLTDYYKVWNSMSEKQRAIHMNEYYGMKYNPDEFSIVPFKNKIEEVYDDNGKRIVDIAYVGKEIIYKTEDGEIKKRLQ